MPEAGTWRGPASGMSGSDTNSGIHGPSRPIWSCADRCSTVPPVSVNVRVTVPGVYTHRMRSGRSPMLRNRWGTGDGTYVMSNRSSFVTSPSTTTSASPSRIVTCSSQLCECNGAPEPTA